MIVVDTTVIADLLLGSGENLESAEALIVEEPEWISTSLWKYEFGNVMLKYHRHGGTGVIEPESRLSLAEGMVTETEETILWAEVWKVAVSHGLSFYDASYVWLARSRGIMLRTRDKKVLRECSDVAVSMPKI